MNDAPIPPIDPERLKSERHDADLGSEARSAEFDRTERAGEPSATPISNPLDQPTSGATPPAR